MQFWYPNEHLIYLISSFSKDKSPYFLLNSDIKEKIEAIVAREEYPLIPCYREVARCDSDLRHLFFDLLRVSTMESTAVVQPVYPLIVFSETLEVSNDENRCVDEWYNDEETNLTLVIHSGIHLVVVHARISDYENQDSESYSESETIRYYKNGILTLEVEKPAKSELWESYPPKIEETLNDFGIPIDLNGARIVEKEFKETWGW